MLLGLLISVGLANAEMLVGQVVGVSDGDTITLISKDKSQHKIRLAGIDAPEKAQAFGQASKQSLSGMVFNKEVTILWTKRDRYQRLVGKVLIRHSSQVFEFEATAQIVMKFFLHLL
jgi:endonuclease YncB( thermonuclease family)